MSMEITPEILRQLMPTLPKSKRELYAPLLTSSMSEFGINNERRVAAYLANLAHESKNLTRWEENLNYSAKRLTEVWPARFPTIDAATPFAHNPEALANRTYGGRMGNNHEGDGWKYRGRFPLQATGKDLYRKASKALNLPKLVTDPDSYIDDPEVGFRVSAWIFAKEKGGNSLADALKLKALTKAINGGYNGLQERIELFNRALRILPDDFKLTPNARNIDSDDVPDYIEGAESAEDDGIDLRENVSDSTEITKPVENGKEGNLSTGVEHPKDEVSGTPPPASAAEVKASQVSWWSKITALSVPTGASAIVVGIVNFAKSIPPYGWLGLGIFATVALIIGYLIYRDRTQAADNRTLKLMDAAADKNKNDLRLV